MSATCSSESGTVPPSKPLVPPDPFGLPFEPPREDDAPEDTAPDEFAPEELGPEELPPTEMMEPP
jgi:hypothetical protein